MAPTCLSCVGCVRYRHQVVEDGAGVTRKGARDDWWRGLKGQGCFSLAYVCFATMSSLFCFWLAKKHLTIFLMKKTNKKKQEYMDEYALGHRNVLCFSEPSQGHGVSVFTFWVMFSLL